MRILVAEDDKKVRTHVAGALRAAGHVVEDTGDGDEAQWLLLENPYDAAVLDIMMPGRDGGGGTRAGPAPGPGHLKMDCQGRGLVPQCALPLTFMDSSPISPQSRRSSPAA